LSRNISTIEKVIILILIGAAILGAGGYFLAFPEYQKIEVVDNQIRQKMAEIERAQAMKEVVMTIGDVFDEKRERAEGVHVRFYGEMTATETIPVVQQLISDFGVEFTGGITVSDIGASPFSLQVFTGGQRAIRYQLRDLALAFGGPPPPVTEETEELSPGQIIVLHLFGEEPDIEDPEIQDRIDAIFSSRVFLIQELIDALKKTGAGAVPAQDRRLFIDTVRNLLAIEKTEVGLITANFTLNMTYSQYLDFLEYVNNLPQITRISSATLYQDEISAGDEVRSYSFALQMCVMKPLYVPDLRPNPFDAAFLAAEAGV
jgi:hypothetical protein